MGGEIEGSWRENGGGREMVGNGNTHYWGGPRFNVRK